MALVTLEQAKDHLRVPQDLHDNDFDINDKVDQATAIVLRYLGTQLNNIETISVANPTVIATSTPHGLTSGTTYTIAGTTTTPTVNGTQVVTVTGAKTFTVPVNVTAGQSAAAGTVGGATWTDATLPYDVKASILLVLEDLNEHRAIGWEAIERLLVSRRDPALA